MLIRFNVGNFLSFKEVQEFSMIAGKSRNKKDHLFIDDNIKLLKFAAIFGSDASGKSNFVNAINFAKNLILNTYRIHNFNYWFKLDDEYRNKKSYFEFEIMINGKYYSYGFEIILDKRKFTSEWLLELYPNRVNKVIFERDIKEKTFNLDLQIDDEKLRNKFEVYVDDIKANETTLFLNELNHNKSDLFKENENLKIFSEIYKWFTLFMNINSFSNLINEFKHNNIFNVLFDVLEESSKTEQLVELIQILLSEENRIYIIDEIDKSLHPQLICKFVEIFLKNVSKRNVQLIIATHESRLLDFNLLRQDEVWLMHKNKLGESKVYSLDEYNVRFDQKLEKAYLEGRYF